MRNHNSHGYFGYDAQWVMLKGKWWYRLDIFDTIKNMPVAYQISYNESNRIVKNFINKSIPLKYRKADSNMIQNKDYDEIMNELGFVHQHCIFHLYKNILEAMQSEINKTVKNYKQELKIKHPA